MLIFFPFKTVRYSAWTNQESEKTRSLLLLGYAEYIWRNLKIALKLLNKKLNGCKNNIYVLRHDSKMRFLILISYQNFQILLQKTQPNPAQWNFSRPETREKWFRLEFESGQGFSKFQATRSSPLYNIVYVLQYLRTCVFFLLLIHSH